jgi:hypothetical protein
MTHLISVGNLGSYRLSRGRMGMAERLKAEKTQ